MTMDEIIGVLLSECFAGCEHVVVHALDPRDETIEIAWPARLANTVHAHATELARAWLVDLGALAPLTREHVDDDALADERLCELAHMSREPALDHRRVLPGEEQHAIAHSWTLST